MQSGVYQYTGFILLFLYPWIQSPWRPANMCQYRYGNVVTSTFRKYIYMYMFPDWCIILLLFVILFLFVIIASYNYSTQIIIIFTFSIGQCSIQILGCGQGCGLEGDITVCQCNPGYQLGSDNTTCQGRKKNTRKKTKFLWYVFFCVHVHVDVNECLEESACSHGCLNTDGGFKCSCPNGLFIGPDRRNCIGKCWMIELINYYMYIQMSLCMCITSAVIICSL